MISRRPALDFALASSLAITLVWLAGRAHAQTRLPESFVYLRGLDGTIEQDIRYASYDNFVGRPLAGYEAAECILKREVAAALGAVQSDLRASGLGLKVYDCYRPLRAVRMMLEWTRDGRAEGPTKRFHPRIDKRALLAGYLAANSRHSAGTAVDVTLVKLPVAAAPPFDRFARYGPCTAPAAQRSPDNSVDMGTGFDCFDAESRTSSRSVGAEQQRWRALLAGAMAKRGFRNYHREWWHFVYAKTGPAAYFDFPIRPMSAKEKMSEAVSDHRDERTRYAASMTVVQNAIQPVGHVRARIPPGP